MENKVYIPSYSNGQCAIVLDKDTIRVYDQNMTTYTDFFVNSHYLTKKGSTSYQDIECLPSSSISSLPIYRNDILDIFIITMLFIFTGYFFISKLIRVVFLGWRWA